MNKYISFDPGHLTGVATWDEEGKLTNIPIELNENDLDSFLKCLENNIPHTFIYEEWTLWKDRNRQFDKLLTVQVIGQLKSFARRYDIILIKQKPQDRLIAAKWAGVKIPKGHMPNPLSAYLHGYYYLHLQGLIPSRLIR